MLFFIFAVMANVFNAGLADLKPQNIFILAGQSNMSGRGGVYNDTKTKKLKWDGQVPPECLPNRKILQLTLDGKWVEAHEPLHKEVDPLKTCGVGPGMPFANKILGENPGFGTIDLVPCALGGTKIQEWALGTELYNRLVHRTKAALQGGGKIRALLWFQGESDTGKQDAALYKGRLEKFFNNVRHDLNYPDLPILMVIIASAEGEFMEVVRHAQLTLNTTNVKHVDAMGSTFTDGKHLDTKSEIRVGQNLAHTFLSYFGH